ncbi:hypothetical protein KR084_003479 [Drosophila pseudotakahashii]|nr:hypothetical protein KR084_003479 [Drosophila pseudotakahashii]
MSTYYFVIVGHNDNPIYEKEFSTVNKELRVRRPIKHLTALANPIFHTQKEDHRHLSQFIAHAALDLVDEHKWKTANMQLKSIDRFNQWFVSAFITASQIRFIIVHDNKNDEGIKNFFNEMYDTYIKHSLNAFYRINTPIKSPMFEKKAEIFGRKYLLS